MEYFLVIIGALALCAALAFITVRWLAATGYKGPVSDHFDGARFYSYGKPTARIMPEGEQRPSMLKWIFMRPKNEWRWKDNTHKPVVRAKVEGKEIVVTFINHATVLIQTEGLNILTDPVWSNRASPFSFAGPKRYRPPGIAFADLPHIDVVLLSHNHYDHMDLATLRKVQKKWAPKIFAPLGNTEYLGGKGIHHVVDMDWWDATPIAQDIQLVCAPAQHFAARSLNDRNNTLWCGFILDTPHGAIYFAGDTGYGEFVQRIRERYESFRFALLPIGAYKPTWFMEVVHMSPEQAVAVHNELNIKTSVGIHFGTFRLADDGQEEPILHLKETIDRVSPSADFRALDNGESVTLS